MFDNRDLFVRRHLSPAERATSRRIVRGLPRLRRLRELMEEVNRLFDRRCRTTSAGVKLAALRARLQRFKRLREVLKKLLSPGLEKALVFLDERQKGATSNAVERGNRRYRKMQKTVRTQRAIEERLAPDLLRESQAQGRAGTTKALHKARAEWSHHPVPLLECRDFSKHYRALDRPAASWCECVDCADSPVAGK